MIVNGRIQSYPFFRIGMMLVGGILVADALRSVVASVEWQWLFVGILFLSLVAWFGLKAHPIVQTTLLLALLFTGGAWRMSCYEEGLECDFTGEQEDYEAVVVAPPLEKERSFKCVLFITDGRMRGKKVNAYFQKSVDRAVGSSETPSLGLAVGDGIKVSSVFDNAEDGGAYNAGRFNYGRQLLVRGIAARTFVADGSWSRAVVNLGGMSSFGRLALHLQALRDRMLVRLRASGIAPDAYATIAAVTLGDKSALTAELRESYSKAGASHVLALSGLHIGIIYGFLSMIFLRRRISIVGTALILVAIWLFAMMVGMGASVVRSVVMVTVYTLIMMLNSEKASFNGLLVAAVLILLWSPAALWDVGFQMSFVAVAGILACNSRVLRSHSYRVMLAKGGLWRAVSLVVVSVAAQIAVLPLVMYYFGRVPLLFIIANFVAIPLTTIIIYMTFLLLLTSPVVILANSLSVCWQHVASGLGWLTQAQNSALSWVASLPCASVDGVHVNMLQLLLYYLFLVMLYWLSFYVENMYMSAHGFRLVERRYRDVRFERLKGG